MLVQGLFPFRRIMGEIQVYTPDRLSVSVEFHPSVRYVHAPEQAPLLRVIQL